MAIGKDGIGVEEVGRYKEKCLYVCLAMQWGGDFELGDRLVREAKFAHTFPFVCFPFVFLLFLTCEISLLRVQNLPSTSSP